MLTSRAEQTDEGGAVVLEGELTIDHAEEARTLLLEELRKAPFLALHIGGIGSADLFGIQVLCSASRFAAAMQGKLTLAGVSGAVREAFASLGFLCRSESCPHRNCAFQG